MSSGQRAPLERSRRVRWLGFAALLLLLRASAPAAAEAIRELDASSDGAVFSAVASAFTFSAVAGERSDPKSARELAADDDERRPADPITLQVFGRPLRVSGEYELRSRYETDPRLEERDDDRLRGRQEIEIELLYPLLETLSLFGEVKVGQEDDLYREDGEDDESENEIRRGELWLLWEEIAGTDLALQVGRQKFRDAREWWWDENLDAARIRYARGPFDLEVGLAEELARESSLEKNLDPEADKLRRWLGRAGWQWSKRNRLELFFLSQRDRSSSPREGALLHEDREDDLDADLTWVGLRASGQVRVPRRAALLGRARIDYWVDFARLRGRETSFDFDNAPGDEIELDEREDRDVRGWALDAGATLQTRLPGEPSLTLGYAMGSGDDDDDRTDSAFRQTGLQQNEGRFRGANRFRYYGDLLDPELSNLQIWTVSIGIPLLEKSSIELSYHRYRQVEASRELRGSGLSTDPRGRRRDIGQELDLSVGLQQWERFDLELNASIFRSGNAFGPSADEIASSLDLELGFNF